MSLFAELRRRSVFRVGAAYAVTAWLLAQMADLVRENFGAPEATVQLFLLALLVGFPVALVLAWLFEITPQGVKRESEIDPSTPRAGRGKKLDRAIIVILVAALGYFVWEARFSDTSDGAGEVSPVTAEEGGRPGTTPAAQLRKNSIAVLPFENFSDDPSDSYFADGLADTLLHQLAQIRELKVIARNSSFQFKGSNRDIREIGEILNVGTVLEGSVQRYGEQVRIIAQLIDTADGAHLWSQSYDDRMENIFALQDRIAANIVEQLELSLSEAELERMLWDSTESAEAYDLYMLAIAEDQTSDELTQASDESLLRLQLLKKAVAIDPGFYMAWSQIAQSYNALAFMAQSSSDHQRYVRAGIEAAQRTIDLEPDYHGGYVSMGFLEWRQRNINAAMDLYRTALTLNPNSVGALTGLGLALLGSDPAESYRLFTRAGEIDPEAELVYRQKAFALTALGDTAKALENLEEAAARFPDEFLFFNDLADLRYRLQGRPDLAAAEISRFLRANGSSFNASLEMGHYWAAVADTARGRAWLDHAIDRYGESDATQRLEQSLLLIEGELSAAREVYRPGPDDGRAYVWHQMGRGADCLVPPDRTCLQEVAESLRAAYAKFLEQGVNFESLTDVADYFLGVAQMESEAGRQTLSTLAARIESYPLIRQSWRQPHKSYLLPATYSISGDRESAVKSLEEFLSLPDNGIFARDEFGLPPEHSVLFAGLRADPAFQDWLARFELRRSALRERMLQMERAGALIEPEQL